MHLTIDPTELRPLIAEIVREVLTTIDWPAGRVSLEESEAATACGVSRHVLRDARLRGELKGTKIGKATVYTREQLLEFFARSNRKEK
jgi:hypothetical protein